MRNLTRIKFTRGREGYGYAERDERGQVVAMLDADGSEVWRMPDVGWEPLAGQALQDSSSGDDGCHHLTQYDLDSAESSSSPEHRFSRWCLPSRIFEDQGPVPETTSYECEAEPLPFEEEGTSFLIPGSADLNVDSPPRSSIFWQSAVNSGLVVDDALLDCWRKLGDERRIRDDAGDRRVARQAVDDGLLTVWQVRRLLRGKSNGFHLDRYLLLDQIGQGGMGQVFLAYDPLHSRKVALKVLSSGPAKNPQALLRFQREAQAGSRLGHENLVRVYGDGVAAGVRFLIMEYVEGKDVARMLHDEDRLLPGKAATIARQVAFGLQHAHEHGLIHRDVSPSNILVTQSGTAKLADLGLAFDLTNPGQVTSQGVTLGTLDYLSPEQARDSRSVDPRSDIYSLGCSLYHMVSGRVPFPANSLPAKLCAHLTQEPKSPCEFAPGLPSGFGQVILKMMCKSPDERFDAPGDVAEALLPYLA